MSELKLPPLQQTLLDPETAADLFRDLAVCTQVLSITPKHSASGHTSGSITLEQAEAGLSDASLRGAQVRYRYEGREWCDTLISTPGGLRVVRICTDDITATLNPS